jgi:hypothetical protein
MSGLELNSSFIVVLSWKVASYERCSSLGIEVSFLVFVSSALLLSPAKKIK